MRPLFLIVPLATGSMLPGSPPLATPAAVPEAVYAVQVVLKETATTEPGQPARIRTHANLSVRLDANREARSGSGGRKTVGDQKVDFGTFLTMRLRPEKEGQLRLTGKLEVSSLRPASEHLVEQESRSIFFDEIVSPGETVRRTLHKTDAGERWLELRLEPVPAGGNREVGR